jgi:hypothetical protein
MSRFDYLASLDIAKQGHPFYGVIMAAMRQADTYNLDALQEAFPATWNELQERYNAPGGYLPEDRVPGISADQNEQARIDEEVSSEYPEDPQDS